MKPTLQEEVRLMNLLGFEEIKPLLWRVKEKCGYLYFDYRDGIKRKSYGLDESGNNIDKQEFMTYRMFKLVLYRINKKVK